jgi:broad specificity phosphatase PhoE
MTGTAARYLYLARHGEASPDESVLSAVGRRQAELLGQRLRTVPLAVVHHGPLARAAQTAQLVGEQLDDVPLVQTAAAGDYVPYIPARDEVLPERFTAFLDGFTDVERADGPVLADQALAAFTGPVHGDQDRHELVVTHNFLVAWLVRDALDAPPSRWLGHNSANCAVTVIRYAPDARASVLVLNDMRHLTDDLRWTGFPEAVRV